MCIKNIRDKKKLCKDYKKNPLLRVKAEDLEFF